MNFQSLSIPLEHCAPSCLCSALRILALDTCIKRICQNKATSIHVKWVVCGGHRFNMSWAVPLWKGAIPGSMHKERIRLRGRGGWKRSWHMCQKRSQPAGSDLSVSVPGRGRRSGQRVLLPGFQTAQLWGDWASPLTPKLLGEAGAAVAGRCLLFLRFSN